MMHDFNFCVPTRFVFGREAQHQIGPQLKALGARKVLIHHDDGPYLEATGLLAAVKADLAAAGIEAVEMGGVRPNPRLAVVEAGIAKVREEEIDLLLAIGGGSVIDSCKAIAAGLYSSGSVWQLYTGAATATKALPIAVLLTNPATSSESNSISVIYNEDTGEKFLADIEASRPAVVFMNPELSFSLPPFVTACAITDMFSHICERYFSPEDEIGVTDRMEEGVLKTLVEIGPALMDRPRDYFLRANAMWIGTIAHNNTLSVGRITDWATHLLGNELSALYDTPHGATLSIMMGSWMRYASRQKPLRFARFAREVFGLPWDGRNTAEAAALGITATEAFFTSMGMPISFAEGKVPTNRIEEMLDRIPFGGPEKTIGALVPLNRQAAKEIFQMAF